MMKIDKYFYCYPNIYRLWAVISVAFWISALFFPYRSAPYYRENSTLVNQSYLLFELGWLGPFMGSIAWYANLPYVFVIIRMMSGHSPRKRLTYISSAIAYSIILPQYVYNFEVDGKFHSEIIYGTSVYLWLLSFSVVALVALCGAEDRGS
ncbi:MAG: hypothetical protein WCC64_11835 [Aliidongia sp.]